MSFSLAQKAVKESLWPGKSAEADPQEEARSAESVQPHLDAAATAQDQVMDRSRPRAESLRIDAAAAVHSSRSRGWVNLVTVKGEATVLACTPRMST